MICHELGLIFIHIPKTAGQSIESKLIELSGNKERSSYLLGSNPDPLKGGPWLDHLLWNEYVDYGYISQNDFTKYFKFSFVRNPWFRLVSEYRFRKRTWLNYSFKEWVTSHFPLESNTDEWRHVMSQYKYICDDKKELKVDFVGKYENLTDDFNLILNKIGIDRETSLPHLNKSLSVQKKQLFERIYRNIILNLWRLRSKEKFHTNYLKYYDKDLWNYVARIYVDDICLFGYDDFLSYENAIYLL